jgi:RNA polymerase sigma-70 factor, ECF subfamily
MTEPTRSPSLTDAELVTQLVAAEAEAAFEILFERHAPAIRAHILSIVRSPEAAEDALQEVFLRVWQRAEQWNGQGPFRAWLYRIATNQAFNYLRGQQRHPELPICLPDEGCWDEWSDEEETLAPGWLVDQSALGPPDALEASERSARLRRMIAGLPQDKREVLRLVHEQELSIRETAGRLGIPEGTVKSRLHYAQKKLSQQWQDE